MLYMRVAKISQILLNSLERFYYGDIVVLSEITIDSL